MAMEIGDIAGNRIYHSRCQFVAQQYLVEQAGLGEAPHFNGVFDGWAGATQDRMICAAGDGYDFQVEIGRQSPVKAQFFPTIEVAFFQGAEIEKAEVDRFLDLVGVVTSQQHPGNVGFNHLDRLLRGCCGAR